MSSEAKLKARVRAWMYNDAEYDPHLCGVNCTQLAENAAHMFSHDEWLDDEQHWVWELAADVAEQVEAEAG